MSMVDAVVCVSTIVLTLVLVVIGLAAAWCMIDEHMDKDGTGRRR